MHFTFHGQRTLLAATLSILLAATGLSAKAAHPLITEDTGTQGAGNWQLEATLDHNRDKEGGARETSDDYSLVLTYGAIDTVDVILTVPYTRTEADGSPTENGIGDVEFAAKWRFYEHEDLSFALRPGITAPTGDEDRGLGTGKSTASLFAVMSYEPGPWAFHLHLGRTNNRNVVDERRYITHYSVAAVRKFSDKLQLVADISNETNTDTSADPDANSAVLGAIYSPTKDIDIDLGYRYGLSDSAVDDALLLGLVFRF